MTTEEKLNALKVVSNAKDKVDAHLMELSCITPDKINFVEINHNGKPIMLSETVSKMMHGLLTAMLDMEKEKLIEKAKELMA